MARIIDLVEENLDSLKALMRHGYLKTTFINDYKIYQFYVSTAKMNSIGARRHFTAEHFGITTRWVKVIVDRFEEKA